MGAAARFAESLGIDWLGLRARPVTKAADEEVHKVGNYFVDYSTVPDDEIAKAIPEVDALLARSRLVSEKRGL